LIGRLYRIFTWWFLGIKAEILSFLHFKFTPGLILRMICVHFSISSANEIEPTLGVIIINPRIMFVIKPIRRAKGRRTKREKKNEAKCPHPRTKIK
jgi:hypothetical protein